MFPIRIQIGTLHCDEFIISVLPSGQIEIVFPFQIGRTFYVISNITKNTPVHFGETFPILFDILLSNSDNITLSAEGISHGRTNH